MRKKHLVFFLAAVFFSLIFTRGQSLVPALKVEGETLTLADFFKDRDGLVRFRNLNKEKVSDPELEEGVINSFIENALVKKELSRRGIGEHEVEKYVSGSLRPEDEANLSAATEKIYAWSVEDFKRFILYPQARQLMLVREFSRDKIDGASWLENAKKDAKISIYLPRWKWEGGEIKGRY